MLNLNTRFSQYDLWQFDSTLVGKRVAFVNRAQSNYKEIGDGIGIKTLEAFPIFKFIEVEVVRGINQQPQIQIIWNKPLNFYAFTLQHPVIISLEMKNEGGEPMLTRRWTVVPSASVQTISIDVPDDIRSSIAEIQPSIETPELGLVRRYKGSKVEW